MLNKLGKKICAGVGAFITVFGSNALSSAMQTKEKAIQNADETAGNVNRNSGGYSRDGAILSPRTFFELLVGIGVLGYEYKTRKGLPKGVDNNEINFQNQIDKLTKEKDQLTKEKDQLTKEKDQLTEEKNQLGIQIDELKAQVSQLPNNAKGNIDANKLGTFFEFLHDYVCPVNYLTDRHNEYLLDRWYKLDEEKYEFVPYSIGENYYSIIGNLNIKKQYGDSGDWKLSKRYKTIQKDKWDLSLTEQEIEEISKLDINFGALDCASIHQNSSWDKILSSDWGLYKYNGGCDINWGQNFKRVFSKVKIFDSNKGWVLCEGFISAYGKNDEGLVVRLTYGDVVKKNK